MQVTHARAVGLIVIGSICLVAGVVVLILGIVTSTIENVAAPAGVGVLISLAMPIIVPAIVAVIAGKNPKSMGLQIAYLVLSIISLIWVFGESVWLLWVTTLFSAIVGSNLLGSEDSYIQNVYTMYVLLATSGALGMLCWCFELAGSILVCMNLCDGSASPFPTNQYGQTTVVVTSGQPGSYPMQVGGYPVQGNGYNIPQGGQYPAVYQPPPAVNYPSAYTTTNAPLPAYPVENKFDQI